METLNRFKEPSTYAAIAAALIAVGLNVDDTVLQGVTQAGTGLAALAAILLKEKGSDAT